MWNVGLQVTFHELSMWIWSRSCIFAGRFYLSGVRRYRPLGFLSLNPAGHALFLWFMWFLCSRWQILRVCTAQLKHPCITDSLHRNSLSFYTGALDWLYRLCFLGVSSHTATVGCWKPFDGLPAGLGVHERDGLEARRSAAGVSAHFTAWNAAVIREHFQGQVVVLTGAHACPHAELKHHDLVRVVPEAQITHLHLLLLQTAVLVAPASCAVATFLAVFRRFPRTGGVCRGGLPADSMTLTFFGQRRV